MTDPTPITIQAVIDALLDDERPFKPRYLYRLSGLDAEARQKLTEKWPEISVQRKCAVFEDMEEFSETDFLLDFEQIAKIGLTDSDPRVRVIAIRLLWQESSTELAAKFIDMLETDEDEQVRAGAASALGHYVYLGELEEFPAGRVKEVEDTLLRTLRGNDLTLVRRRALEALGFSSHSEMLGLIENAYASDDDEWITSALFAMGRSARRQWGADVVRKFTDTNPLIRMEAARAAGELAQGDATPPLLELLEDADDDVRAATIWSLSQIGSRGMQDVFGELLQNTEDEDEIELLENALENLTFAQDIQSMDLFNIDPDDIDMHEIDLD